MNREWVIGRDSNQCDLVVGDPGVSTRHCLLIQTPQGLLLEDLGSTNGTIVNGVRINSRVRLTQSDHVTLGQNALLPLPPGVKLPAKAKKPPAMPSSKPAARPSRPAGRVPVRQSPQAPRRRSSATVVLRQSMTFGRDPDCDQTLSYPMISWRHARLSRSGTDWLIEDLGSTNGTFLNGQRVQAGTRVGSGDIVSLGTYQFKITPDGQLERHDYQGNVTIDVQNVTVDVPGKRLIEDVSLTILPGEFVGLMGPSGAGKTTLMNALNGYTPPSSGDVLLNSRNLYANYAEFSKHLGYVPQDDIIHRDLAVGQALYYSARLRLPADYTKSDIRERIADVLKQLGLEGTENVLIGSAEKKGISGGQRKRVNLAMELLTDPLVLFLDEPTSGLSSEDTLVVMKLLRSLADAGKTILLTIHQPSLEAYRLMDHLVLVAKDAGSADPGRLAYFGPAYPDSVEFFNPGGVPNAKPGIEPLPDEVLRGLSRKKTKEWTKLYARSKYQKTYIDERAGDQTAAPIAHQTPERWRPFDFSQWWTLTKRCLTIKSKDTWNTAILMAQAPIVGVLVVMVFGDQIDVELTADNSRNVRNSIAVTTFLMALSALWFGCSNAVRDIVGEWAVYHRERMVNLKIPSYVLSKFTVLGLLCLIQCMMLLGIVHAGCSLEASWFVMLVALLLTSLVGVSIGLVVSSVARSSEVAIALLPLVLLPMVILGGVMQPLHKMSEPVRLVSHAMPSRWGFEALLVLESDARPNIDVQSIERSETGAAENENDDNPQANSTPSAAANPQAATSSPTPANPAAAQNTGAVPPGGFPTISVVSEDMAEAHFSADHRFGPIISLGMLSALLALFGALVCRILRLRDVF